MKDAKDLKVIYLAGLGRSGGTLLGRVLGEIPGVFYAGEVYFLWADGLVEGRLCQCGQPFTQCPFWKRVLDRAFSTGWDVSLGETMIALQKRVVREKNLFRMLLPFLQGKSFRKGLQSYYNTVQDLYQSVLQSSGANCLVDSSRHVVYMLGLTQIADVFVVHLVRDVRGVVYSYQKKKYNPASNTYLPNIFWGWVALEWIIKNVILELVCKAKKIPYIRVRYEDFVKQPQETLRSIAKFAGVSIPKSALSDSNMVEMQASHVVGGNPDKFKEGVVRIVEDVEWITRLGMLTKIGVTIVASPMLVRYCYPLRWSSKAK